MSMPVLRGVGDGVCAFTRLAPGVQDGWCRGSAPARPSKQVESNISVICSSL
jgi:hypothetical protein